MPRIIRFRDGRLDYSGMPDEDADEIVIDDITVSLALWDAGGAILPPGYRSDGTERQTVPLTSIVVDFRQRMKAYDPDRLRRIIVGIRQNVALPPINVQTVLDGTYRLVNGYHRFLACALIGFSSIPIDRDAIVRAAAPPPDAPVVPLARTAGGYVPPHKRNRG